MVPRHECPKPDLINPTGNRIKNSGDTWICKDVPDACGRVWFVCWGNPYAGLTQPQWLCTTPPDVPSLAQRVTALTARSVQPRQALAPVVALASNATLDVAANWDTPFPDADYRYDALIPAVLLGKVTVTPKTQTADGVVVTVKATAATLVVANLTLIGTRWGT